MGIWLFIIHAAATWFMTGLVWFTQIVHYPLFTAIGKDEFPEYEKQHQKLATYVVLPAMALEAGTAVLVAWKRPPSVESWIPWSGLILVAVIWLSTFLSQAPQHEKLAKGFDPTAHALLVSSNWVRTVAWSARSVIVALLLHQIFSS
jgi:hypothetical protein